MDFIKYLLIQTSQKLSGPVWVLGHFHISLNWKNHEPLYMIIGSLLMTSLVISGIWLDYKQQKNT
jgi:hypothetical protein